MRQPHSKQRRPGGEVMPRRKTAKNCTVSPWLSARPDNQEGRFIQAGNSLLLSEKYGKLPASAKHLYLCAAMESGGRREFTFPASAMKKYHINRATAQTALTKLEEQGFIKKIRCGKCTRTENVYKFSFEWKGII